MRNVVASSAKGDQVLLRIITALAAKIPVVRLQAEPTATTLALPAVTLQHLFPTRRPKYNPRPCRFSYTFSHMDSLTRRAFLEKLSALTAGGIGAQAAANGVEQHSYQVDCGARRESAIDPRRSMQTSSTRAIEIADQEQRIKKLEEQSIRDQEWRRR
jgi:hypothetical protein